MALVERVLLQRAREFQRNGLRVNATKEERKENLDWAVAEVEKIPNRASYVEHGWDKTDFDFVGHTLVQLLLENDDYEKALNQTEVILNELKEEQLEILDQRLVEARGANDRSGITRYVIV
jgi:3',5'-cyclic AMP phosphodiesterase CpdA